MGITTTYAINVTETPTKVLIKEVKNADYILTEGVSHSKYVFERGIKSSINDPFPPYDLHLNTSPLLRTFELKKGFISSWKFYFIVDLDSTKNAIKKLVEKYNTLEKEGRITTFFLSFNFGGKGERSEE